MRKPKRPACRFKITSEILRKTEELAERGLTHEQIAASLGITISTLYERKRSDRKFSDAIRRGMTKMQTRLTNALFRRATWDLDNDKPPDNVSQRALEYIETHRKFGSDEQDGDQEALSGETDSAFAEAERLRKAALDAQARIKGA